MRLEEYIAINVPENVCVANPFYSRHLVAKFEKRNLETDIVIDILCIYDVHLMQGG